MTKTLAAAGYFIIVLLVTAPASLLDGIIQHMSHHRLSLANCQGTIWRGSATPLFLNGKNSSIALHTVHWSLRPQALLQGQIKAVMSWDDLESRTPMQIALSRNSVILTDVLLQIPAEVISELSPFLKPAQFNGSLTIESPHLAYTDNHLQGSATARWNQAGSAMSAVHPLGNYRIDIAAAQDSLRATLTTQSGVLLLGGQGNWSPQQGFHFNGTATAAADAQPALSELLHHLGPEVSSSGVYQISL